MITVNKTLATLLAICVSMLLVVLLRDSKPRSAQAQPSESVQASATPATGAVQRVSMAAQLPNLPRENQAVGNAGASDTQHRRMTAGEERRQIEASLHDSGPDSKAPWTVDASQLLEGWKSRTPEWVNNVATTRTPAVCYRAGCVLEIQYNERRRAQQAIDLIGESFSTWPGPRIELAPDSSIDPERPTNIFVLLAPR